MADLELLKIAGYPIWKQLPYSDPYSRKYVNDLNFLESFYIFLTEGLIDRTLNIKNKQERFMIGRLAYIKIYCKYNLYKEWADHMRQYICAKIINRHYAPNYL